MEPRYAQLAFPNLALDEGPGAYRVGTFLYTASLSATERDACLPEKAQGFF
jgi:hypothetical protein